MGDTSNRRTASRQSTATVQRAKQPPQRPRTATNGAGPVSSAGEGGSRGSAGKSEPQCVDCRALPESERSKRPRPAPHGGPRSRRCDTHQRAHVQARKARAADARRLRVYGVTPAAKAAVWALQGGACPCGRQPTREPDTDHDHVLARQHGHPEHQACGLCWRGLLCRGCNTYLIGRYSLAQLRAVVAYLEDPPAARLNAVDYTSQETVQYSP